MYSEGQPLVEVFGVHFLHGGQAPAGTVTVYDGKRGQIIYSGGPVHKPSSRQTQRPRGALPLTGPYRAISADGCVAIVLDLHHGSSSSPPIEILLDVYDDATRYDEPITYDDGQAEVTYALLSNAAEAVVEVRLPGQRAGSTVSGTVIADTNLGEVVLFDDDCAEIGAGTEEEAAGVIPLARSVVAVPLASSLTIEVDLVVRGGDEEAEVVKGSVVCEPKLRGEEVYPLSTTGVGAVEVKVTWLD